MKTITRDELKQNMDNNADFALVEVLGPEHYQEYHLPGAINIPEDENFATAMQEAVPDKNKSVVVYCANKECQASPKAAERLTELGYQQVYDYEGGKQDWLEAELPVEKQAV